MAAKALVDISCHTPSPSPTTCLDTWNVPSLNTRDSLSCLIALSRFMHHDGVCVLTVQETRIRQQTPFSAVTGLKHYRAESGLQSHTSWRYCRVTVFLVCGDHRASFANLGTRSSLLEGYGAVWACFQGQSDASSIYLASVYCTDTDAQQRNPHFLQEVDKQLSLRLTHYCS
jgi:exonuclease III